MLQKIIFNLIILISFYDFAKILKNLQLIFLDFIFYIIKIFYTRRLKKIKLTNKNAKITFKMSNKILEYYLSFP